MKMLAVKKTSALKTRRLRPARKRLVVKMETIPTRSEEIRLRPAGKRLAVKNLDKFHWRGRDTEVSVVFSEDSD